MPEPDEMVMFSMRLPWALKQQMDGIARLDGRTTSSLIQAVMRSWIAQEVYKPSFNASEIADELRASVDLRPKRGRQRSKPNPRMNIRPFVYRMSEHLRGRDRLSDGEFMEACKLINAPNNIDLMREFLFREGWREYRNGLNEDVWARQPRP